LGFLFLIFRLPADAARIALRRRTACAAHSRSKKSYFGSFLVLVISPSS
jgi:hypothetical protein